MNLSQLNISYACSSLILGDFGEITLAGHITEESKKKRAKSFKSFVNSLRKCVTDKDYNFAQGLTNHPTKSYAHVIASTSHHQPDTEKYLEEFGFSKTETVDQMKNPGERITLWFMPVYKMLQRLEELKNA